MAPPEESNTAGVTGMKLRDLMRVVEAELIVGDEKLDLDIQKAFAADLMSDVLAFAGEGGVLLTGLTNAQVVRTADMVDISAILFVRGKRPQPEAVERGRGVQGQGEERESSVKVCVFLLKGQRTGGKVSWNDRR